MGRLRRAAIAAGVLALACASALGARPSGTAEWGWHGNDSAGREAEIVLARHLPGSSIDTINYVFSACADRMDTVAESVPVGGDGSFTARTDPLEGVAVAISGKFEGRRVSGTARVTSECASGRMTSESRFAATCDPCGENAPAEDPGVRVLTALPIEAVAPRRRANGLIAFVRADARKSEILTMNARGGGVRTLTRGKVDDHPSFSPDGRRIVFARRQAGRWQLYVMGRTGAGVRRLATGTGSAREPDWSPDGKRIVFSKPSGGLWLVNADGSGLRRLTNDQAYASEPTWSPDGRAVAYYTEGETPLDSDTYVIEGTQVRRVARNALFAEWSPDGSRLAFVSGNGIAVINANGTGRRVVARVKAGDGLGGPSWSPDGRAIVFNRGYRPHPYQEIAIVGASGGPIRRLTRNFVDDIESTWGSR